jgi:hypothetical protein
MKRLTWVFALVTSSIFAAQQAAHTPAATPPPAGSTRLQSSKIVVPADTTIPLELKNTINSRTAYAGEAIYCATIYPITVGDRIVIPVGTYVKGEVTQVTHAGRVKGKAQLGIRFRSITLPNGTTRALRATLSGFGGTGNESFNREESKIKGQSSKGEEAGKVAQTTITGAEIGTIAGAGSGNVGKGLGIGSAAGAAGGLIWLLASRGKEIVLPRGTNLELQLSTPLSFDREELDPPSQYRNGPAIPAHEPGPGF